MNNSIVSSLLDQKHFDQRSFCDVLSSRFEIVVFKAKLKTPLITGIGESHPNEISMVFDHNMGIPYIPASGIKGIVRFAHTLGLIDIIPEGKLLDIDKNGKPCPLYFDDEDGWTDVPKFFGTQNKRGSVIFIDAYPEKVPDLHVDIMNPHYGDYYSDEKHKTPPADYLTPVPIKFLTVAKETVFMFRALVSKENMELVGKVKSAFNKALTEEGVGAKTAIGYGRFGHVVEEESESVLEFIKKENDRKKKELEEANILAEKERKKEMTPDQIMLEDISNLRNGTIQIADLVKDVFEGDFGEAVYLALKEKLNNFSEWKPYGSKQKKEKMRNRNSKIESKINKH